MNQQSIIINLLLSSIYAELLCSPNPESFPKKVNVFPSISKILSEIYNFKMPIFDFISILLDVLKFIKINNFLYV